MPVLDAQALAILRDEKVCCHSEALQFLSV
jgi:hypothetical protein